MMQHSKLPGEAGYGKSTVHDIADARELRALKETIERNRRFADEVDEYCEQHVGQSLQGLQKVIRNAQ